MWEKAKLKAELPVFPAWVFPGRMVVGKELGQNKLSQGKRSQALRDWTWHWTLEGQKESCHGKGAKALEKKLGTPPSSPPTHALPQLSHSFPSSLSPFWSPSPILRSLHQLVLDVDGGQDQLREVQMIHRHLKKMSSQIVAALVGVRI